ncbi:MAG: glycosyltransferase family 4 protein [Spirochaetia bacterium]|nr:glycosyltransferase family 4 protein [Spirochaetia bacterium]
MKILIVCTTDSMIWNFLIPHIEFLKQKGAEVECACSRTGFYFDELIQKYGLVLHEINFARNPFKIKNLKAYSALCKLVKDGNFSIINCHEPVGGALARLAGKRYKKYVMYTAHGFHFFKGAPLKHWVLYHTFEYILSFFTDCLITICKEDFENAKKLHAEHVYYIPGIGINFNKFKGIDKNESRKIIRNSYSIKDDDIVLISVGELSIRKNHEVIIKAMGLLKKRNIKLLLCGEGEKQQYLKELAIANDLKENIFFLGFRKDIPTILYASDIFIYPSLWEGLGIAGLEAMYAELPIIGSSRQGIKDYITNDKTGLLFEPNDIEKLAQNIEVLSENVELRKKIGKAGYDSIKQFSLENALLEMDKIYLSENIFSE